MISTPTLATPVQRELPGGAVGSPDQSYAGQSYIIWFQPWPSEGSD